MTTNQPDTDEYQEPIDEHRMADLDDVGLIGYSAVVVVTRDGEERLVLCWRDGLNTSATYWPANWRQCAPHELTGRLPKAFAPTCGRTATSSRQPCRVRVAMYGDACPTHAEIEAERN